MCEAWSHCILFVLNTVHQPKADTASIVSWAKQLSVDSLGR